MSAVVESPPVSQAATATPATGAQAKPSGHGVPLASKLS